MTIDVEGYMTITPANWIPGPGQGNWTYNSYATLPEDGHRYEIVDGVLFMTPAPDIPHQKAVQRLSRHLEVRIEDIGLGQIFVSPVDVELSPKNVSEPDVVVVLNAGLDKVKRTHIVGSPDLVVEVASPSTRKRDHTTKRDAYAHAGIKEYWLVDTTTRTIEVLFLQDGAYRSAGTFSGQDMLVSQVVPILPKIRERW
jgi:Uma2 family endonuclease